MEEPDVGGKDGSCGFISCGGGFSPMQISLTVQAADPGRMEQLTYLLGFDHIGLVAGDGLVGSHSVSLILAKVESKCTDHSPLLWDTARCLLEPQMSSLPRCDWYWEE